MRILSFIIAFLAFAMVAHAQDIVTMRSGEEIPCKVFEITPEMVKYKQLSNLEGPLISIFKKDVFMIKYENGSKEVFGAAKPEETKPIEAKPNGDQPATVTYSRIQYKREPRDHGMHNLIKFNLSSWLNGDYPFYYERRLADHISGEVSLGLTHKDLLYEGLIFNLDSEYQGRDPRFGFSARVGFHFYPSKYIMALEDWYFGPEVHVRQYNSQLSSCGGVALTTPAKEYRRLIDFRITGGYVVHIADQVVIDWYGAIGVRSRDEFRGTCDYTGPIVVVQQPIHEIDMVPVVALGVKIGFGF